MPRYSICGVVARASTNVCVADSSADQRLNVGSGGRGNLGSDEGKPVSVSVRYSFIELERSSTKQMSRSSRTTVASCSGSKSHRPEMRPSKSPTLPDAEPRVRRPRTRTLLIGVPLESNTHEPLDCRTELPNTTSAPSMTSGSPATRFSAATSMAACRASAKSWVRDKASPAARADASVADRSFVRRQLHVSNVNSKNKGDQESDHQDGHQDSHGTTPTMTAASILVYHRCLAICSSL